MNSKNPGVMEPDFPPPDETLKCLVKIEHIDIVPNTLLVLVSFCVFAILFDYDYLIRIASASSF